MGNKVVGIIRDENGQLEDVLRRNSNDFFFQNELGETVVYSFFEEIEAVPSTRGLFEAMLTAVTEKLLEKGIPVKGFIFTKSSVIVLQEDDSTAYTVDWPGAANVSKISVSVGANDSEDDDDDEIPREGEEDIQPEDE